jgi:hypothetical protein
MRNLANPSNLPPEKIAALKAALKGGSIGEDPVVESSLPHGHALTVTGMIGKLGLPRLLYGKRHHLLEPALAMVAGRAIEPSSRGFSTPSKGIRMGLRDDRS